MIYMIERSYTETDVPKYFYIVTDLEQLVQNDISKPIPITGISDTGGILLDFLGAGRDCVVILPGKEVEKQNSLSRFMYDNPNYFVSNGLYALYRLFSKNPDRIKSLDFVMKCVLSDLSNIMRNDTTFDDQLADELTYESSFFNWHKIPGAFDESKKIKTLSQFVRWFQDSLRKVSPDVDYDRYTLSLKLLEIPFRQMRELLEETLKKIGRGYSSEGEWVVKDKRLRIPEGSHLVVMFLDILIEPYRIWKETGEAGIGSRNIAFFQNVARAEEMFTHVDILPKSEFNKFEEEIASLSSDERYSPGVLNTRTLQRFNILAP